MVILTVENFIMIYHQTGYRYIPKYYDYTHLFIYLFIFDKDSMHSCFECKSNPCVKSHLVVGWTVNGRKEQIN